MTIVNLRDMPELLMRRVKAQAAMEGISMRQYIINALENSLKDPEKSTRATKARKT